MDIKIDVDVGNIGKIYRNDQGVLAKKLGYKEMSFEKLKSDLGIESPSLLWKDFQCAVQTVQNVPRGCGKTSESIARQILKDVAGIDSDDIHELTNKIIWDSIKGPTTTKVGIDWADEIGSFTAPAYNLCIKPSPTYFFANPNDIRRKVQTIDKPDANIQEYVYKVPGSETRIRVVYDRDELMKADITFMDHVVREIAIRYDDMMCRRYFNMSAVDFRILSDKVERLGGMVSIEDRNWHPFTVYAGPMVNIQLPAYKLDRLKIENELVYQHMCEPIIPVVDKIVTHNDRVTIVYFVDGTFTKCVCGKDEEFNLYTGVAFCLFKKMLSRGGDDGHKKFNTMMRKAMKTIEDEEKLQKMICQAKHEEKLREAKRLEKKRLKEFKKKEEQIYIMQEALRRDREAANSEEE